MTNRGTERAEWRGPTLALLVVSVLGFPASWFLPPPTISIVVSVVLIVVVGQVTVESLAPGAGNPRPWPMFGLAVAVAIPAGFVSFFCEEVGSAPLECGPVPTPDDPAAICSTTTHAERVALGVWVTVMVVMAIVFVACVVLARRSRIAGWAVIPIVLAGCTIAFDIAHLAALATGREVP